MTIRIKLRRAYILAGMAIFASSTDVSACGGFAEAPISCDDPSPNGFASWMLGRVAQAIKVDKSKAFEDFTNGAKGFRTADTYVFCVGPDGTMNAHPNPILHGHDVRDLHDKTGNYFIKKMMLASKPGEISVIRYLFPKPGSTIEEPKTTYYTKADDQTCAVGVYDADIAASPGTSPQAQLASLQRKLDAEIPESARADWNAFIEALQAQKEARQIAAGRLREKLKEAVGTIELAEPVTVEIAD